MKKNIIFEHKKVSTVGLFLDQLKSPIVYILLFSGLLTILFREFTDTIVIGIVILINTLLGFVQEYKAQNTLYHLRNLLKPRAIVIKHGKRLEIDSDDIQIGDIVVLSKDYSIPADGEVTKGKSLLVNEALITGESVPVMKSKGDEILAGTTIIGGIGQMKVTEIGTDTRVGKIGKHVLEQEETKTPLQNQIAVLARNLSLLVIFLVILLFLLGIFTDHSTKEMLYTSVAVAVAAIPEGLVITLTVILAIGMQRILKRKAIVSKLVSAETLGSVSVICVDKTGTITEGLLTVVDQKFINKELGEYSVLLCNNEIDPLETSMMDWIHGIKDQETLNRIGKSKKYKRIDGIPFNTKNNYTATLHKYESGNIAFVFGAPEVILSRCKVNGKDESDWNGTILSNGFSGKRVLGFAYKLMNSEKDTLTDKDLRDMTWNGVLMFDDPVREGVKKSLRECVGAGIKIKMITGDYPPTAFAVAKKIGLLPENASVDDISQNPLILTGDNLKSMDQEELKVKIEEVTVFARTGPFQKLRIVNALRENGEVVAMTGDGVNDAPALKSADIGVVVNEASDISKNTADVILLDSNFDTIVHAIEEGRVIFDNIRKSVLYLLSDSLSEVILIAGTLIMGLPLPVTAIQILWINLMEDTLPALSLAFEPKESDVMNRKPRPKNSSIINKQMKVILVTFILITDLSLLLLFKYLYGTIEDISYVRTMVFLGLGMETVFYIFACKSISRNIFQYNPFSNKYLNISVLIGIALLVGALYIPFLNDILGTTPLRLGHFLIIVALGVFNLVVIELVKAGSKVAKVKQSQG